MSQLGSSENSVVKEREADDQFLVLGTHRAFDH